MASVGIIFALVELAGESPAYLAVPNTFSGHILAKHNLIEPRRAAELEQGTGFKTPPSAWSRVHG